MKRRAFFRQTGLMGASLAGLSKPLALAQPSGQPDCDVLVVGGTSAGVAAAIGAGWEGARVVMIEESPSLGGMLSNGLSGETEYHSPSGVFSEMRRRLIRYYSEKSFDDPVIRSGARRIACEPHVADQVLKQMVAEIPSIKVHYGTVAVKVLMEGRRVVGVVTEDVKTNKQEAIHAAIVIDATHEGDLLPLSGTAFRLGREPWSPGEPHAGKIYTTATGQVFGSGEGDDKIQAYCMMVTIQDFGAEAVSRAEQK